MIYFFFISCLLLLVYTYVLYPAGLRKKAALKTLEFQAFDLQDDLPVVNIIIPACNEERVIAEKLDSILNTTYPTSKIFIHIGLDNCTDNTLSIIQSTFNQANIRVTSFHERQGKPTILNQLTQQLPQDKSILILTDANVFFTESTIFELVRYFKDARIGLVDSNIQPQMVSNVNERDYWNYETEIKENESLVYGMIPGPSGGCYAIRRELFTPVPPNFLVDDFFIGFTILTRSFHSILNKSAVCHEDVVTNWKQEFIRKIRISTGNFQNLWYFRKYAFQPASDIGKVFLAHKVLRWKTPFFLLILYYILLLKAAMFILIVTLFLPIIDLLLFTFGVEFKPLRRFHYFIVMNVAVFIGFIKFCKGVKTNVWQPTTRN